MGDETRKAIGLFWDIENCRVPRFVSALSVVQRLRERFFDKLREAEFMCVCDINKEHKNIIEELNSGQVNVVHISATAKNAADDKIRQSLRRFADTHPPDTRIILVSGDVNFASDLSDLRHRKQMYIILLHGRQVHEALLSCAHEHYVFDDIMADLPRRIPAKSVQNLQLVVRGYPSHIALDLVKKRLLVLSNNCGGRVVLIDRDKAYVALPTQDALNRAKRRMEGEDVYGMPISVTTTAVDEAISARLSPSKYKRNNSPAGLRSHSKDRPQVSPATGAVVGQQNVATTMFSTTKASYPAVQNTFVPHNLPSQQNVYQGNVFQPPEEGGSYSAPVTGLGKKDSTGDLSQSTSNIMMLQRQAASGSVMPNGQGRPPSDGKLPSYQIKLPNPSDPPSAFSNLNSFSSTASEGNVSGPVNSAKPFNVPFPTSYAPRLYHPQPVYPYQQQASVPPPMFNPGPRQSGRFNYNAYNRPRSQNSNVGNANTQQPQPQGRPYSSRSYSTSDVFDDDDEDGLESAYFKAQQQAEGEKGGPVDLTVTNLDYNISKKEWRKILAATFQPQVQVLGICVRTQADNTSIASVKVPSIEDARYAISQFHRRKIGYKRINVTLNEDRDQAPAESTRQETISVLSDSKAFTMPVFKFIENYEKRYHKSVSVSDLYKMKDVVEILDRGGAGRMVRLAKGVCPTPSPTPDDATDPLQDESLDQPVCLYHCPEGSPQYAEAMSIGMLPNVRLQRKHFASHVHYLLLNHNGVMPLMSFPVCYSAEFGILPVAEDNGVPMEHLISCVPGVEIIVSKKGVKVVHFQENKDPPGAEAICGRTSPMLSQQMALLSREIGDLLRQSRTCSIPASKFIPAYHHHFGRQCRVADYGYTKLAELFDALPHVLQVLGTGDRKVLTLSHRAQVKRFIADVLKVLKTQPGKQLVVADLPATFERMLFRKFDITHYGVAFVEDMFMDIPPTSIMITMEDNKTIMAIPKRDQTAEEMKRTEQFGLELVDLLKHNPQCRMIFNRFIPAYHHHFGRQCRVSDYGFTRLTDLFESVPHVVEILDDEEERMIKLTAPEMRRVLAEQMTGLLRESAGMTLPLTEVLLAFQRQYGFPLRLSDFGVHDVKSLLAKIKHCVYVDEREKPPIVKLQPSQDMPPLAVRVVQLLMDQSGGCLPLVELCSRYRSMVGEECDVHRIQEELVDYVQLSAESDEGSALIRLTALQVLGRDLRALLRKVGCVALPMLGQVYQEQFTVELKPALYGFPDIASLLKALPHIVKLTGRPGRKFVELSPVLGSGGNGDDEVTQINRVTSITRFEDYLSAPVPSTVPSPELLPAQSMNLPDLMSFEQSGLGDRMWNMSEDEKKGLDSPLCRTPTSELLHMADASLPNPNPPQPSPDVFPGDVPLTSAFPPPPPLPTDMAPPPLTEGPRSEFKWPVFMSRVVPPPPLPPPRLPTSTPNNPQVTSLPSSSSFSSSAPPAKYAEPAGLRELPAASLQWKETLEKGCWNPTPQQLNNLASMGLLGLGRSYSKEASNNDHSHPVPESQSRSLSAPTCSASEDRELKVDVKSRPQSDSACSENEEGGLAGDPSIVQSSLYTPFPAPCHQPAYEAPLFGKGLFTVVKVKGQASQGDTGSQELPSAAQDASKTQTDTAQSKDCMQTADAEGLEQALDESLNLSGQGDITVLEKSIPQMSPASPKAEQQSSQADTSAGCVQEATSDPENLSEEAQPREQQPEQPPSLLTPAGDASVEMASSASADNAPGNHGDATGGCEYRPIPANDSFSIGQPLDTSSIRSAGSGSGSVSDAMSLSPSPKKNPRRARLAAKFVSPRQ